MIQYHGEIKDIHGHDKDSCCYVNCDTNKVVLEARPPLTIQSIGQSWTNEMDRAAN